jgi:tetratricopeptide (TPR) repeat protein
LKKHCLILALLCFCFALSPYAQDEQLVHKTHSQRVKPLLSFYDDSLKYGDSARNFKRINNIKKLAIDNNDDDLLMEAELLRVHYFYTRQKFPATLVLSMAETLLNEAIKKNKPWLMARVEALIALYDFHLINQYELAFEHFQKLHDLLVKFNSSEFPLKQTFLYQIGFAYYQFVDYRKAIFYLDEALLEKPPFEGFRNLWVNILNTLGVCYQRLRLLDSSDYYFNLTYQKASAENNRAWQGISSGNLGYNYFLRKQYDKAVPLLRKDVDVGMEYKYWGLAAFALMPLASISLERKKITEAEGQLHQARNYIYVSGQNNVLCRNNINSSKPYILC